MSEHDEQGFPADDIPHTEGLSDEDFSSLLESINTMAPLLKGIGGVFSGKRSEHCQRREALLLSLKPYLSPTRCEAIDYMVRLGALSEIFRGLGG